jgi:tetratricopeptide (TPR) repeat protein
MKYPDRVSELSQKSYAALIYDSEEEYEEIIQGLSAALQADPGNMHILNNRAVACWEIGRLDLAISDIDLALTLYPDDSMLVANRRRFGEAVQSLGSNDIPRR